MRVIIYGKPFVCPTAYKKKQKFFAYPLTKSLFYDMVQSQGGVIMKKTKRLSLFLLLVTLLFNFFAPACSIAFDSSSEPPRNSVTPYVPLSDDFKDDRISVRIKEEYSEVNKPWYPEDFHLKGIGIAEIIDTTYCDDPSKYSSWPFSHQRLKLILSEPSKENVIAAIHQIETLYFVKFAEPEFILFGADDNSYTPNDTGFSSQWGLNNTEGASIKEILRAYFYII